jgi:hypothetical protein
MSIVKLINNSHENLKHARWAREWVEVKDVDSITGDR